MRIIRFVIAALAALTAGAAAADQRCKSVDFTFENQIDNIIRIDKLYYFDTEDDKNRRNNIRNRIVQPDTTIGPYNISLPYVGAEPIARFFVEYHECTSRSGSTCSSWGSKRNSRGYVPDPVVTSCAKNMDIHVIVTRVGQLPN